MRRFVVACRFPELGRRFIFPRGVSEPKGAFIGNFPRQLNADANEFHNQVPFVYVDASLMEVSRFLAKYDVGCVPVLCRGKTLQGMVSERDLARAIGGTAYAKAKSTAVSGNDVFPQENDVITDFTNVSVSRIMSTNVVSVVQGTSLSEVLLIMDRNNFRHVPVVSKADPKEVVGLISMRDIMHKHVNGESTATVEDFMNWVLKMSS
jgi:CBS domain-containing protein